MVIDGVQHRFTLHAQMAACELSSRKPGAASPRAYMDGQVPGGRSENMTPASQG